MCLGTPPSHVLEGGGGGGWVNASPGRPGPRAAQPSLRNSTGLGAPGCRSLKACRTADSPRTPAVAHTGGRYRRPGMCGMRAAGVPLGLGGGGGGTCVWGGLSPGAPGAGREAVGA